MKKILTLTLLSLSIHSFSQCDDGRYRDIIFADFDVVNNITYGSNISYNGADSQLKMDVYTPAGDTADLRPLVIFMHGGFFITGDKTGSEVVPACQDLAKMGYVTASINYRLGYTIQMELAQPMTEAVMRGVQDVKAAIRFFRKDVAENGNTYRINTDQIFIAGISAGGFATLHAAYMQDDEIPALVDQTGNGLGGGTEGLSGNEGYSSDFLAVISIAGAISDTSCIDAGEKPACLAHGTGDTVVPFDSDMLVIGGFLEVSEVDGSNSVSQKLDQLGIENCFEIYEMQGHVPSDDSEAYYDTTLSIISNFMSHFVCAIDLDCSYREIATEVKEIQDTETLTLYPNPASDAISISFPASVPGTAFIYDLTGRLVVSPSILSIGKTTTIDISGLPGGAYKLVWKTADHVSYHASFVKSGLN